MAGRQRGDISGSLARGRDRFEAWRRTRKAGTRIPEKLWALAAKLAEEHGLSRTASTLKLDYHGLRKRVEATGSESVDVSGAFVEFASPSLPPPHECVLEFEDGSGARMRVQLQGCNAPDLVALVRSFRSDR